MPKVSVKEAELNFSELVELALQGEDVVIERKGKPLLKLVPVVDDVPAGLRPIGLDERGVSDGFIDASMQPLSEEELEHWHESNLLK